MPFLVLKVVTKPFAVFFDRTCKPLILTGSAVRKLQIPPITDKMDACTSFLFFQFIPTSKLPRAFKPDILPSDQASGKAGNSAISPD